MMKVLFLELFGMAVGIVRTGLGEMQSWKARGGSKDKVQIGNQTKDSARKRFGWILGNFRVKQEGLD